MLFLTTLLASVLLTVLMVPLLSPLALRLGLVDVPNERKVHEHPVPRIGGLAMVLGAFAPVVYWLSGERFAMAWLSGGAVLAVFGLMDDFYDLKPRWKLLGQIIAAAIVIFYGGVRIVTLGTLLPEDYLLPPWIGVPLTLLTVVGVTNAINLADGLDGLAGGISLLSIACIGYLAYLAGYTDIGLIALALCGAVFGFLRYNTHPATIFMGDAGSQFLGFSAITLSLALTQRGTVLSPLLPLIILGFPVMDTVTVMTGRIRKGRSPFVADKTHFHHSLLDLGFYQTESVFMIYLIQVALIVAALTLRFYSDWLLLSGYIAFSAAVLLVFSLSRRRNWHPKELTPLVGIKESLRHLRYDTSLIKYLFRPLKYWLIVLLIVTSALTDSIPGYAAAAVAVALVLLLLLARYFPKHLDDNLRTFLYIIIPTVIYLGDGRLANLGAELPGRIYNLSFAVLALLTILVSKLSRRKKGFKSTPLDFLILFVVVIAPSLSFSQLPDYREGMIAGKIIVCYFALEVLMAEMRGETRRLLIGTVAVLAILVGQGLR